LLAAINGLAANIVTSASTSLIFDLRCMVKPPSGVVIATLEPASPV
jgi:hypothetical protein